jgi:DNA-binding phage protein
LRKSEKKSNSVGIVSHHDRQTEELRANHELARGLLDDAVRELINGEEQAALVLLRDLIAAAGGFPVVAKEIDVHPKALHRMLSVTGNPTASNLSAILKFLMRRFDMKPAKRLLQPA